MEDANYDSSEFDNILNPYHIYFSYHYCNRNEMNVPFEKQHGDNTGLCLRKLYILNLNWIAIYIKITLQ